MSSIYAPPEIVLEVDTTTIAATNRKLKAVWTMEAQEDLRQCHNIDAEQDLVDIMTKEICDEIDNEILNDLRNNAKEAAEKEWGFKNRKKKILPRSITEEWEVSRFD